MNQRCDNPLERLVPLMAKHGVTVSPSAFQKAVNLSFHRHESEVYDVIHQEMWLSLPLQFKYLAGDVIEGLHPSRTLRLLDVGCGTGLSTELLLNTRIGDVVTEVTLLDTSAEMLERSRLRAQRWRGVRVATQHGEIDSLRRGTFDLVLACSVLHHIPNLPEFVKSVSDLLSPSGVFIHLQDPNADALGTTEYLEREGERKARETHKSRWIRRLRQMLSPSRVEAYLDRVNSELISSGLVQTPLTDDELWQVTDLHVGDGKGLSLRNMARWMGGLRALSIRSYSFYGQMWSRLPRDLQRQEEELCERRDRAGYHVAGAWQKAEG